MGTIFQAETLDILSDVRGMRQQLFEAATERQEKLLQEKQEMAMRLYAAGMQVCLACFAPCMKNC